MRVRTVVDDQEVLVASVKAAAVWCHDGGLTMVFRVVRGGPQTTMQPSDLRK
jgi:hypothetical protein